MVLSSVHQTGSTLFIIADPGTSTSATTVLLQQDQFNHSLLDVYQSNLLKGQFTTSSINTVYVQVAGNDVISVNDSFGFPFNPGTDIWLFGSGTNNQLAVVGNRAISGQEYFYAGTLTQPSLLDLAGSSFYFDGFVPNVVDEVANANGLIVQTNSLANVTLTGTDGVTETLSGLAGTATVSAGGNNLTFSGKANVALVLQGFDEVASLESTAAAQGLKSFEVQQDGYNDTVYVRATPSFAGIPGGGTYIGNPGQSDQVLMTANSGYVSITGNSSTTVTLGTSTLPALSVTSGINGLVSVFNVGVLDIYDGGNATTRENVTVTERSITGTGLFGTNGSLQYSSAIPGQLVPYIVTGQLAETYTVTTSSPTASFNALHYLEIEDDSTTAGLNVTVDVNAYTDLDLSLVSKDAAASSLFISAPSGTYYNHYLMTSPSGFEQVIPPGALHSTYVSYTGFDIVGHS